MKLNRANKNNKMSFIKKGTTIVLVLLLFASVIAVLFSMSFYRNSFGKINSQIEDRDNKIDALYSQLSDSQKNLSEIQTILDLQIKRESNLSSLFTDLKTVKEKTDDEKKSTEGKLNQTQGELLSIKLDLNNLQYKYMNLNSSYASINASYALLLKDVDKICSKVSSLNISQCQKYD